MEYLLLLPFTVLLISIAVFPFAFPDFWKKHYGKYSVILGSIIAIAYILTKKTNLLVSTLEEYFSFISLLSSLFVVSGGIFFQIRGKATPFKNVLVLFAGGILANIFGTTGAAMLLIRPYINSNKYRLKPYHIVFFIFIVCNIGGSLTPIGDPPLFLGYLKGIPFFWVIEEMFIYWGMMVAYLLLVFYIIDYYNYHKLREKIQEKVEETGEDIKADGLYNIFFLFVIIGAVFVTEPLFLRELIMLGAAYASYKLTSEKIHKRNKFHFEPIREVALLFIGIFITMMPVLEYLSINSTRFGIENDGQYFWPSGLLTSFLDNAPTYLNFMTLAFSNKGMSINFSYDVLNFIDKYKSIVIEISIASVFFGAMTYIGNGPNFMVKSISEHKNVKMPGFFGYIVKYSIPVLLPAFILLWYFFFR